jgi:filamentous hemagglutinin family protein
LLSSEFGEMRVKEGGPGWEPGATQSSMRFLILTSCFLLWAIPAAPQVVRDGSIGPTAPLDVGSGLDPNGDFANYLISEELGEIQGGNLFHSFDTFSVASGEVATFTGPTSITRIVSRTTGSQGSFLFGTLRSTIPQAEIFFLSPGGLVIGQGAQLDVPGSVHFSTATVLRFGADPGFDLPTGSLARPIVLSSMPPSAFGFGPDPAPIAIGAVATPMDPTWTLSVPPGETLSIVGGDVTLTGVPNEAPFFFQGDIIGAPGANVEIASTAGNQDVPLRQIDGRSRLDLDQLPADLLDGQVLLQQNARIDVGAPSGTSDAAGSVVVRAGSFRIIDGRIEATHRSDGVDAGVFDIGTRDSIQLDQARLTSSTEGAGRGSDILLASRDVSIGGGSLIRIISTGAGKSGDFSAEATTISVIEEAQISSINTNDGGGGDIRLQARGPSGEGRIVVRGEGESGNGARFSSTIFSNPRGDGVGGTIALEADAIELSNSAEVLSITRGSASGTGGSIEIHTADLIVESGSFVSSSTEGDAPGGAITAEGLDGSSATSLIVRNAGGEGQPARISTNTISTEVTAGPGGVVTVRAESIDLLDGGQIFARTEGSGDAGVLTVEADSIRIAGILANPNAPADPFRSGITSRVGDDGALGTGTLLSIDTRILEIENGGQVSTATFGIGHAGELRITSRERLTVTGGANGASRISAQAVAGPTAPGGGQGGLITIETERLELRDGGQISSSTTGAGNPGEVGDAGHVFVRADHISISGAPVFDASGIFSSSISATALPQGGNGGDVELAVTGDLDVSGTGRIEVSTTGNGDAGTIRLDLGGSLRASDGAQILSSSGVQTPSGAGSVTIVAAGNIELDGGSQISASTGAESTGQGGFVSLTADGDLQLTGASSILSRSAGRGDAGDIEIMARRVFASGGSEISTQADAASGGSITVEVAQLFELADSNITTSVEGELGTSDAGNIFIRTPGLVVVNHGSVVAQAVVGAGGQIGIFSDRSFISGDSVISASSAQGPQGEIKLTPPEDSLISELASLPAALEDPSQLLRNACDLRTEREGSFTVRARPSASAPPGQHLNLPPVDSIPPGASCSQ